MKQISAAIAVVLAATFVAIAGSSPPASALAPAAAPSSAQADGCLADGACRIDVAEVAEVAEPAIITYSIVLVTSEDCQPCETAKEKLVPWLETYGWEVQVCDGGYRARSFPTWVVLREGTECHRWSGAAWSRAGRATVIQHLRTAKGELEVAHTPSLRDWINSHYTPGQHLSWGVSGMSVRSHLQDGSHGNHIWRDEQIDGLSEWEMLCLHDATHRGLTHPGEW